MKTLVRLSVVVLAATILLPGAAYAAKRKTAKTAEKTRDVKVEEIGVLRNEDVRVVQKNLYTKKGHHEIGFLIAGNPFDVYVNGVMAGADITLNLSEKVGVEFIIQGGYGWGNGHWRDVTFLGTASGGQLSSLGSDAARSLVGGNINVVWSPIYAKLAWGTKSVLHFDIYGILGAHGFLAQRLEADAGFRALFGPSAGLGIKFFLSPTVALKLDVRDNISIERRSYTGRITARNNWQVGAGLSFFTGRNK